MPRRPRVEAPLRSKCPVAAALDVFGDRWTLLVVRDLVFYGKRRYRDFLASPEGIATNILADRLERLAAHGLIERRPGPEPQRRDEYHPTAAGLALEPALREMIRWGQRYVPGTAQRPPAGLLPVVATPPSADGRERPVRRARRSR
jgi:DNA-binding HxlR family transcriptional regulator